jgi:protein-tyrosine phosphatase
VDDGSRSVEQSVRVLLGMQELGVTAVCLTPHLRASRAPAGIPAEHDEAFARLAEVAPAGVSLARGVELMLDRPLTGAVAENRRLTLGGSRYLLVEFPRMVAGLAAASALQQIRHHGLIPVLAHPERYTACTPAMAVQWRQAGAVLQVDATTLFMPTGRGQRARELVEHGLADLLAADNHGDERTLAGPYERLMEEGASIQADLLVKSNPAAILADEAVAPVPAWTVKTSLFNRIKSLFNQNE